MLVAAATLVVGLQVALAREASQAATTRAAAILRAVVHTPAVAQGRARLSEKSIKKLRNRPSESLIS